MSAPSAILSDDAPVFLSSLALALLEQTARDLAMSPASEPAA